MQVRYIGSGDYCYANSLAIVLHAKDEPLHPEFLECLTCVGNSAFWAGDTPFFSSFFGPPDLGINRSLTTLGYTFKHTFTENANPVVAEARLQDLRLALKNGPVLVGPMEMSRLIYNPNHKFLVGVDHYITVIENQGDFLQVHDPKGFPFARIHVNDFMDAWRAETIAYRQGSYSMWTDIDRVSSPSSDEIMERTIREIATIIRRERVINKEQIGIEAIRLLAHRAREKSLPSDVLNHLAYFAFPVGAKRANDYYGFFLPYNREMAMLKYHSGTLFGAALSSIVQSNFVSLADILMELADVEATYQDRVLESLLS